MGGGLYIPLTTAIIITRGSVQLYTPMRVCLLMSEWLLYALIALQIVVIVLLILLLTGIARLARAIMPVIQQAQALLGGGGAKPLKLEQIPGLAAQYILPMIAPNLAGALGRTLDGIGRPAASPPVTAVMAAPPKPAPKLIPPAAGTVNVAHVPRPPGA